MSECCTPTDLSFDLAIIGAASRFAGIRAEGRTADWRAVGWKKGVGVRQ
jgi:hypothetical protein